MPRIVRLLAASVVIVGLVSPCAHADKLGSIQKTIAKRYPGEHYVTSIGVSAASPEQATEQAKAEVSSQIRFEQTREQTTEKSAVSTDGHIVDYQRLVSRTESRTSFAHAELIKLDNGLIAHDRGQWYVVAVLDRDEAAGSLQHDYDLIATDFRAGARRLLNFNGEILAWTAGLRHAEADFLRLFEIVSSMRGLRRRPDGFDEDLDLFKKLQTERIHRLASVRLALQVESPKDDPGPLAAFVGDALSKLGLGANPQGCADGGYVLDLNPHVVREQGFQGMDFRLAVPARIARCGNGETVGQLNIDDPSFHQSTTHYDQSIEPSLFWKDIKQDRFVELLGGELSPYLPVSRL